MTDADDDLLLLDFRMSDGKSLLKVEVSREEALAILAGYMRLMAGAGIPEPVEPPAAVPPSRRFKVVSRAQ